VSAKKKRLSPQQRAAQTRKRNRAKQEKAARERSERARKAALARWKPKPAVVKTKAKKPKSKKKKSKKDRKIEALEKRLKDKEKRIERFQEFFLTESLFNQDGSARFTELQNLPERRRYETDTDYADRLVKVIQREAIYSVDQAYRVISHKTRLTPREIYTLFRSPKISAAA
jgi:hypothetical protein